MNKIIIGALGFLALLVLITLLFASYFQKKQQTQTPPVVPAPTRIVVGSTGFSQKQLRDKQLVEKEGKIYSPEQRDEINKLQEKLPFRSADFDMEYSDAVGEYFIQTKTSSGEGKLNEFLQENNASDVRDDFSYLFNTANSSAEARLQKEEDELSKARLQQALQEEPTPAGGSQKKTQADYLVDSGKTLLSFNFGGPKKDQPAGKSGGGSGAIAGQGVLDQIFNEAGQKVGTPPKMLKAIMSIECGRLLVAPAAEIVRFSAPGAGLPPNHSCYRNQGGYPAFGPMQFVPGTFARYGSSINRYGGYAHRPNIQNIRDSVYAAAEHFLLNSGAKGGNWSAEQIKRAYVCYAAGCRQYDTGRLGKDTQRLFAMFLQRYNSY